MQVLGKKKGSNTLLKILFLVPWMLMAFHRIINANEEPLFIRL